MSYMKQVEEQSPTYPYPLRASELIRREDLLGDVESLKLSSSERSGLLEFEKPFFKRVEQLREITVSDHKIYPEAFTDEKGRRLFAVVYLDGHLDNRIERLSEEHGVELDNVATRREVYDAFFDDVLEIAESDDQFEKYKNGGIKFPRLSAKIIELGGKRQDVILAGDLPRVGELEIGDVEQLFYEADSDNIPKRVRERANRYSSDWARQEFQKAFLGASGDVSRIENPHRITRVVDVNQMVEKLEGLRELKRHLKEVKRELGDKGKDLVEAKRLVLNLYGRYINVLIAGQYKNGRAIEAQPAKGEKERRVLRLVKGVRQNSASDRFDQDQASRTMERIDHFLKGTGVGIDEDGMFETVPEELTKYAQIRVSELAPGKTEGYGRYNKKSVNAEQFQRLCNTTLREYGLSEGEKFWTPVVLDRKGTLIVTFRDEGEKVREIRIPKTYNKGLVVTLGTLSHEVEGHVLRYVNQEGGMQGLRLLEELTTGRTAILAEALSMKVEADTLVEIVAQERRARPYYFAALAKKMQGGSFKDCFFDVLRLRAKREYGKSVDELLEDNNSFATAYKRSYQVALRIFRKNTPLDDASGFVPSSAQLKYLEQELIFNVIANSELKKALYVAGIDLYSIQELRRLGMLDLEKVEEPRMVVAKVIWPKIKKALDDGKSLDEAITMLETPKH